MDANDSEPTGRLFGFYEIVSIVFFCLCLLVSVWSLPFVLLCLEWAIRLHKGDTGYHLLVVVPVAGGGGLIAALVATLLAWRAKRLPRWFRVAMVALPAGHLVRVEFAFIFLVGCAPMSCGHFPFSSVRVYR